MPKIITGFTGEPHVTADDMASFQQAFVGKGDYLLCDNPEDFTATQINMSTIQLSKAEVCIQGTHIRILDTDTVTIEDGQSGLNRIDIIALCYSKDESGVENAEIKVIKGEPDVDPVFPAVVQSDIRGGSVYHEMPLFIITVTGVSISNIERVYNNVNTLDNICTQLNSISEGVKNYEVLWSGAYYMDDTQTIALSKKISEMNTGIVLVFSAYSNKQARNYEFNYFFVPKFHVANYNGLGERYNMVYGTFQYFCTKYLYIHDDHIAGYADNNLTGTSPVVYKNNGFVLRYVIGI